MAAMPYLTWAELPAPLLVKVYTITDVEDRGGRVAYTVIAGKATKVVIPLDILATLPTLDHGPVDLLKDG